MNVGARAVVLVYVTHTNGTAVYNLHDQRRGDVSISVAGKRYGVDVGQHAMIVCDRSSEYGDVNPIESIAHANLRSVDLTEGGRMFSSNFSLLSAIAGVKALAALQGSADQRDRRLHAAVLKNAAILMHTRAPSGAYRRIPAASAL